MNGQPYSFVLSEHNALWEWKVIWEKIFSSCLIDVFKHETRMTNSMRSIMRRGSKVSFFKASEGPKSDSKKIVKNYFAFKIFFDKKIFFNHLHCCIKFLSSHASYFSYDNKNLFSTYSLIWRIARQYLPITTWDKFWNSLYENASKRQPCKIRICSMVFQLNHRKYIYRSKNIVRDFEHLQSL